MNKPKDCTTWKYFSIDKLWGEVRSLKADCIPVKPIPNIIHPAAKPTPITIIPQIRYDQSGK